MKTTTAAPATTPAKKPYATPTLTRHGSVAALTQSGSGRFSESALVDMSGRFCTPAFRAHPWSGC